MQKIRVLSQRLAQRGYKKFYFACIPYTSGMGELTNIKEIPKLLRLAAYSGLNNDIRSVDPYCEQAL